MTTRVRLLVATAALVGAGAVVTGPAFAEPEQICVAHTNGRRGICFEIDIPPGIPLPR